MKKSLTYGGFWYNLFKTLRIMRLSLFMIVLSGTMAFSSVTYSQSTKLTLDLNNVQVKDALKAIENQSEFLFFYQQKHVDLSRRITIQIDKENIESVLEQLFAGTDNIYVINDRQIVIGVAPRKELEKQAINLPDNIKLVSEQSQQHEISGKVTDSEGLPLPGVSIIVKGTTIGTVTNADGNFTLTIPDGAETLQFSFVGMLTQEVTIAGKSTFTIMMQDDVIGIEDVVVTAYGIAQKKASTVGSIQQIRPMELKLPTSSLSATFAGRLAGVIAVQSSGEPGADGSNFWIRGKSTFSGVTSPLIILDGVEISAGELNSLDPEVIESFSILKDATATALYGMRGANGVMIVATKTGKEMKPTVNFRIENALSQMNPTPKQVDAVTYMHLFNEAITRPGSGETPFSDEQIQGTAAGLNPYIYPNVNWYDETFKKNSLAQRLNLNLRGGGKIMDYFMSAGIKHNEGNLRSLSKDYFSFDNNLNIIDYDFINNLRVKPTSTTNVSLGLNLSIRDWKGPGSSASSIFDFTKEANPVDFPIIFPAEKSEYDFALWGDKPGGPYNDGYRNPIAEMVTGYRSIFTNIITANLKLEQELDMILKGLNFIGLYSFKNNATATVSRSSSYNHFEVEYYDPETLEYEIRRLGNEVGTALSTSGSNGGDRRMYFQAILNYDNIVRDMHYINVMTLYNHEQYDTNAPTDLYTSLPKRRQGIATRFSYDYDHRYLAEINFGYNGSENFAEGYRFGFFPSIALGYNISEENFWNKSSFISHLKLRASWGLVGNDQTSAGRFAFLEDLKLTGSPSYTTGYDQNKTHSGPVWSRYYNPDLTWEIGEKFNFGMDLKLFHSLDFSIDLFQEMRSNIFMDRASIPLAMGTGSTKLFSNLGVVQNRGLDSFVDYNRQINENLILSFKGSFTFAQNKVLERDEPEFLDYPNLSRVGIPMDLHLAYIAKGLFPDQETIDNSPEQTLGYAPMPGDIWYENLSDVNGNYNNFIDANDRKYVGYPKTPEIVYGLGSSVYYKKFDFSIFFQGVARTSLMMSGFHPFGNVTLRGISEFIAEDLWTTENQNVNAKYPRLTKLTNLNNEAASTFWLRDASFLKLKNIELGYTYKNMRLYLSGLNLYTFSSFKLWDPEMGGGNGLKYPTQKVFNLGFQMTF